MSLDVALNSALSGLKVSQSALSVLSQNIANVNTQNYSRRVVEQLSTSIGGIGQGVEIGDITRKVDTFLIETIRIQNSTVGEANVIKEYNDRIQLLVGAPGGTDNLNVMIDDFFSALGSLATNPELTSLRSIAVTSGIALASRVSSLASDLEQLRYDADRDVTNSVTAINNQLDSLYKINLALDRASSSSQSPVALLEDRDNALQKLSEYLDISVYYRENGKAVISTANGKSLLDDSQYQLQYSSAASIDTMINDQTLNTVTVSPISSSGVVGQSAVLVTSGVKESISTLIHNGKLKGLVQLRDIDIPSIIDTLDNLAQTITDTFNAIHNDGAGYPAATVLTGTTGHAATEEITFIGSVRIAVLDDNGFPLDRGNGDKLNPLTLNLGSLDSGSGAGLADMQTIIDEINQYFFYDPVLPTTTLGDLVDIKLVATTTDATLNAFGASNSFTFDFELNNDANVDTVFAIQSITVEDNLGVVLAGVAAVIPSSYNAVAGTRTRTGSAMTVDFSGGTASTPYYVIAQVQVTNEDGVVSTGTIRYPIVDPAVGTDIMNDRYVADMASGDATLVPANATQRFAYASLVDEDGGTVGAGERGFLKIETERSSYHLAIDELDSQQLGLPATNAAATNKGFSHYFGLNNFFTDHTELADSAINMTVREDIAASPNLISLGEMSRSPSYSISEVVGDVAATGYLEFTAIPTAGDTVTMNGVVFTFVAGATAVTTDIEIGISLPITLTNIAAKLNGINAQTSGTVDKATYTSNGFNGIDIIAVSPGSAGNAFTISAVLSAAAAINSGVASATPNGVLQNGEDTTVTTTFTPNTYGIGSGSNQAITRLSSLLLISINFDAAGGLPTITNTLSGYAGDFTAYTATKATRSTTIQSQEQMFQDGYVSRFQEGSGVNLDEELANTIIYQNSYTASARVITVTKELFQVLFEMIR